MVEPNVSTQGIAVLADTLTLNGGDIESVSSDTDANPSHDGLDHDSDLKVNWKLSDDSGPRTGSRAAVVRRWAGSSRGSRRRAMPA